MSVAKLHPLQGKAFKKDHALWQAYQQQKAQNRMLFPLEGAKQLQVSEFELLLASPNSQYLGSHCKDMLDALSQFNRVESIVRNELAVHEKIGRLDNLKLGERMGIALNVGGLDLRFFISNWHHMLSITDTSKADETSPGSFSIQFFDAQGHALCKIFLRDYSDQAIQQWYDLIAQYSNSVDTFDTEALLTSINALKTAETSDLPTHSQWHPKSLPDDKRQKLQRKWLALTDIHQFHMLLKSLNIDRASSYQLAPEGMAYRLEADSIEALLELAQTKSQPIMVFVSNRGMVQIQTGIVHHVKRMGDWINILDKKHTDFTLHLKDKALAQVWCVKRPTKDGIVTCIEGFDTQGISIVSFFGQRQEGEPEHDYWREITAELVDRFSFSS